jgi:hypothetical protein
MATAAPTITESSASISDQNAVMPGAWPAGILYGEDGKSHQLEVMWCWRDLYMKSNSPGARSHYDGP